MELSIAMVTGFVVWVGYVIFGSKNQTLEEVAKQYDVTRKRIREIEEKVLRKEQALAL